MNEHLVRVLLSTFLPVLSTFLPNLRGTIHGRYSPPMIKVNVRDDVIQLPSIFDSYQGNLRMPGDCQVDLEKS